MKHLHLIATLIAMLAIYSQTAFGATATLSLNLDDASHVVVSMNYSTLEGLHDGENIITFQDDRYPVLDIAASKGYAIEKVLVNGRQQSIIGGSWTETLTEDFAGVIIKVTTRELITRTVTLDVTGAEFIERCYINDEDRYKVSEGISTYDFTSDKVKFSFTFSGDADVKVWVNDEPQDVEYNVWDTFTCEVSFTESGTLRIEATENMIKPAEMNITGVLGIRTLFVDYQLQTSLREGERVIKLVGEDKALLKVNFMPDVNPSLTLDGEPVVIENDAVEVTVLSGSTVEITTDIIAEEDKINAIADNPHEVKITTGAQDREIPLTAGLNILESSSPYFTITFADNGKPHLITVNGEETAQPDEDDPNVFKVYLNADYYNQLKLVTDASYLLDLGTGVKNLRETEKDGAVYNIFGMRMDVSDSELHSLAPGIYIVNGKKRIVR